MKIWNAKRGDWIAMQHVRHRAGVPDDLQLCRADAKLPTKTSAWAKTIRVISPASTGLRAKPRAETARPLQKPASWPIAFQLGFWPAHPIWHGAFLPFSGRLSERPKPHRQIELLVESAPGKTQKSASS